MQQTSDYNRKKSNKYKEQITGYQWGRDNNRVGD